MPRFCTAIDNGCRCDRRARPGERFCSGHRPGGYQFRQCEFLNARGIRCRCEAMRGQDHCFTHSRRNRHRRLPRRHILAEQQSLASLFSGLPQPQRAALEALLQQQFAPLPMAQEQGLRSA